MVMRESSSSDSNKSNKKKPVAVNLANKKKVEDHTTVEGYQRACLQIDKERQQLLEQEQMLLSLDPNSAQAKAKQNAAKPKRPGSALKHVRQSSQSKLSTRKKSAKNKTPKPPIEDRILDFANQETNVGLQGPPEEKWMKINEVLSRIGIERVELMFNTQS